MSCASVDELLALLASRAERLTAITAERAQLLGAAERDFTRGTKGLAAQREREVAHVEAGHQAARQEIASRSKQELDASVAI